MDSKGVQYQSNHEGKRVRKKTLQTLLLLLPQGAQIEIEYKPHQPSIWTIHNSGT